MTFGAYLPTVRPASVAAPPTLLAVLLAARPTSFAALPAARSALLTVLLTPPTTSFAVLVTAFLPLLRGFPIEKADAGVAEPIAIGMATSAIIVQWMRMML